MILFEICNKFVEFPFLFLSNDFESGGAENICIIL